MNNKELIEESNERAKAAWSPDLIDYYKNVAKALQDAEADCQSLSAIHLHEEAKLLEEINRLKAELHKANIDCFNAELDNQDLKSKLSKQIDPIEFAKYLGFQYRIKEALEKFKKERKTD